MSGDNGGSTLVTGSFYPLRNDVENWLKSVEKAIGEIFQAIEGQLAGS